MKTSHLFLSLVSLSLTVLSSGAAITANDNECVQLPAYTVSAPRQTAAEKQIERNLAELRESARKPVAVEVETPLLRQNPAVRTEARNEISKEPTKPAAAMVVARN